MVAVLLAVRVADAIAAAGGGILSSTPFPVREFTSSVPPLSAPTLPFEHVGWAWGWGYPSKKPRPLPSHKRFDASNTEIEETHHFEVSSGRQQIAGGLSDADMHLY